MFDLLIYLVENRDRVVSKDDLIENIWDGRIVSESTLTSRINAARNAVGDTGKDQKVIRTIARKGFRFVGEVSDSVARAIARRFVAVAVARRTTRRRTAAQQRLPRSIGRRSRCCRSPT